MQAALRPVLFLPLALPFTAAATEPTETEPLVVEYSGSIFEVSEAPPEYIVGHSISGRLLIDRSVSHPDLDPTPSAAFYRSDDENFVGDFWGRHGDGFDVVSITDEGSVFGISKPMDFLTIEDWFVTENASLDGAQIFGLHARLHDFLSGPSLDLNLDLTAADVDEPHEGLFGLITFSNMGPIPFVSFVLDRLTVKPKSCVAPR
jgi:hypothetical protein